MRRGEAAKATVNGITISQSLPPMRPLRGLRGERSQSASRTVDQRRLRCSRQTSATTSTNCQITPPVKRTTSALIIGTSPVPASPSASEGATSHASTPIGTAAAAQTARIARSLYCGISTFEASTSGEGAIVRAGAIAGAVGDEAVAVLIGTVVTLCADMLLTSAFTAAWC